MADQASQTSETPVEARAPAPAPQVKNIHAEGNRRRGRLLALLGAGVLVAALVYGIYWLNVASHFVSTDNAYVNADTAEITPLAGAPVAAVLVGDTQVVKAGDVLVRLDDADAQLSLAQARADLARAQAD